MLFRIIILSLLISSCKTQQGYFQESRHPAIVPIIKKKLSTETRPIKTPEVHLDSANISLHSKIKPVQFLGIPVQNETIEDTFSEKKLALNFVQPDKKWFVPRLLQKEKPKKKGKKFRQISSNLFIGFVFLGIAIVLALIKLGSLSLLFGLVSMVFLYIGLKKIWKKKQRRQKFKDIFS